MSVDGAVRRGRPPGTSARELELIALRLFTEQGFDETTIDQIAAEAGVSRRTYFRYFDSKAGVLWGDFDPEVDAIRAARDDARHDVPMMDAIRQAVVAANHYRAEDVPELRARMNLIGSVPALQASAAVRYDAWERAISRLRRPASGSRPTPCTRSPSAGPPWPSAGPPTTWAVRADADLTVYLDAALRALAAGFPRRRHHRRAARPAPKGGAADWTGGGTSEEGKEAPRAEGGRRRLD